ncbi:hypothetical protein DEDE109153_08930 [Deinococcus deserti]
MQRALTRSQGKVLKPYWEPVLMQLSVSRCQMSMCNEEADKPGG